MKSVEDIIFRFIYADNQTLQEVKIFKEWEGEIKPHHEKRESVKSPLTEERIRITPYNEKGEIEGLLKEYDKQGQLRLAEIFIAGERNGLSLNIANGVIYKEEQYKNDLLNGTCRFYNPISKALESECKYKDGKKIGTEKHYGENGKISLEIPFVNGVKEGIEREFYESGELKAETPYKNGVIDGTGKCYLKSGEVWCKTSYKNGKIKEIIECSTQKRVSPQVKAEQEKKAQQQGRGR